MAFVIADRVRETSTTIGTGNFTLAGAVTGYQTFDAALDTGDTTYYTIADQSGVNWEVGIGTFTSPSTLARTTILSSSNGGSVVTFGAGTKDVFISLPASKTVQSFSAGSTGLTPSTASFGAVALAGTLVPANGGTGTSTAFTAGSVVFAGASGVYAQDNASLFFDDTNNRLGIGTVSPDASLTVNTIASFGAGAAALPSIAAKGDLDTGVWFPAANTIAASTGGVERLRIDTSGNATFTGTLVPNSSFLRNRIINGNMLIDQRNAGASVAISTSPIYTVDRWTFFVQSGSGHVAQQISDAPAGFSNSLRFTVGTGASPTSGQQNILWQPIEGFNVLDFGLGTASATTFTASFWVKASVTGIYGVWFQNSGSSRSFISQITVSSSNTWEYKTVTVVGDTLGTWLRNNGVGLLIGLSLGAGSTFQTTAGSWASGDFKSSSAAVSIIATSGATFQITGVQLEVGTAATPFERRQYGQELALCQRYFQIVDTFMAGITGVGTTNAYRAKLSVTMRATPTVSIVSSTNINTTGATVTAVGNEHFQHVSVGAGVGGYISEAIGSFSAEL